MFYKTDVERRQTLNRLRSAKPNKIKPLRKTITPPFKRHVCVLSVHEAIKILYSYHAKAQGTVKNQMSLVGFLFLLIFMVRYRYRIDIENSIIETHNVDNILAP